MPLHTDLNRWHSDTNPPTVFWILQHLIISSLKQWGGYRGFKTLTQCQRGGPAAGTSSALTETRNQVMLNNINSQAIT